MGLIAVSLLAALLITISASNTRLEAEAKPLNQNQVKFRRLPPKEFSAALGSSITIECEAGGSPPPSIHWLKNGRRILQSDSDENQVGDPIQVDDVNRIALSSTRSRLFIDCANFQDEAVYTCVAENAYSRIASHTRLNLIKPPPLPGGAGGGSENDLFAEAGAPGLDEVASQLDLAAAVSAAKQAALSAGSGAQSAAGLSAMPQCLSQERGSRATTTEPVRIHMWTHNIVEIMKNNIILYCRSNVRQTPSSSSNHHHNHQHQKPQQSQDTTSNLSDIVASGNKLEQDDSRIRKSPSIAPFVTWALPDDKLVSEDQKDKYEILETGDLLIKDLRWSDMGSYVCTVSDEQSSDSISTFVYPASVKVSTKRSSPPATPLKSALGGYNRR